jgi:hypothetical protein
MVALPADTPLTTPVEFTVASDASLDVQVPPAVASERVIVEETQTLERPVIGAGVVGRALTVTT